MSNLLKSKFFLGVMMVVAFAFVAVSSASAAYMHTVTLKQGSSGSQVMELQKTLGVGADGAFGPMTKAAVMSFQSANGLTADGVVGPMTGAKLAGGSMGGSYPAGCSSASGYSTTTGMSCASSGGSYPAGCTSTSGYSPTTGAKCSDGSTGGSVSGGAGDVTLSALSTYSGEDVVAGQEDAEVLAFEVEADDESDVEITSVKVEFVNANAASSDKLDDYAESVSIWLDGDMVGEADADEFSESSDYYSKSISLNGAIVRAGEEADFVVAVTALSNLDSGDIDTDTWEADLLSVRFEDGDGVVTTETADAAGAANGTFSKDFDFDDLSTSGDLEAKITENSDSPDATSIEVDDTADTNDVLLLAVNLKATGSEMTVDQLTFDVTPTGANANEIVSEYKLVVDGEEIDSIAATSIATTVTGQIVFTDLEEEFMVGEDDTVVVELFADVNDLGAGFTAGDTILASLTSTNFAEAASTIEDANSDTVLDADRTGSVTGELQTFYTDGIAVSLDSVDADAFTVDGVTNDRVELMIKFKVTAFGADAYIPTVIDASNSTVGTASTGTTPTVNDGVAFHVQSADAQLVDASVAATTLVSTADEETNTFKVNEGSTETFTLNVVVTNAAGVVLSGSSFRAILAGVAFGNGDDAAGDFVYTSDLTDTFKTPYAVIAD